MTPLYTTEYGSRLYGTNTPSSDRDLKTVVLPNYDDLLLGRPIKNKFSSTGQDGQKNTADDVDSEQIPVQIFARDFMKGQSYALELAFSVHPFDVWYPHAVTNKLKFHADQTYHSIDGDWTQARLFSDFVQELKANFLTNDLTKLVGYAITQANMYSDKGERFAAIKQILAFFENLPIDTRVEDHEVGIKELIAQLKLDEKYFSVGEYDIGSAVFKPCFFVMTKCIPFSATTNKGVETLKAMAKSYGNRSEAASQTSVDWKAMMQAARIINNGIELLSSGYLTLPVEPAIRERLLKIKKGDYDVTVLRQELEASLHQLMELENASSLPDLNDEMYKKLDQFVLRYLKQWYK